MPSSLSFVEVAAVVAAASHLFPGLGVAGTAIHGVAPEDMAKYVGPTFRCPMDGFTILLADVNDGYCDCPKDGSDEPGTGACTNQEKTLFYCKNEGSIAKKIFASRVSDGICDCCDGADEAMLGERRPKSACPNTCKEQGIAEKEDIARRILHMTDALAKKQEAIQIAQSTLTVRHAQLKTLQEELEPLRAAHEAAKVEAEKYRAERAAEQAAVAPNCMWRQTGDCNPNGEREPDNDKSCSFKVPSGSSGFCDCDGDGVKADSEKGLDCKQAESTDCVLACAPTQAQTLEATKADGTVEEEGDKKPKVSEYARWMDGAEEKLSEGENPEDAEDEAEEGSKIAEGTDAEAKAEAPATDRVQTPEDFERVAKNNLDSTNSKIRDLQQQIDAMPESHLGYSTLEGTTLSRKISEFKYEFNFFKRASQDHTSLGNWKGWSGKNSGWFGGGARCWDGPEREININFECGSEAEIKDVFEPSRCVYQATVAHPGACEEEDLAKLQTNTRIIMPREEL